MWLIKGQFWCETLWWFSYGPASVVPAGVNSVPQYRYEGKVVLDTRVVLDMIEPSCHIDKLLLLMDGQVHLREREKERGRERERERGRGAGQLDIWEQKLKSILFFPDLSALIKCSHVYKQQLTSWFQTLNDQILGFEVIIQHIVFSNIFVVVVWGIKLLLPELGPVKIISKEPITKISMAHWKFVVFLIYWAIRHQ